MTVSQTIDPGGSRGTAGKIAGVVLCGALGAAAGFLVSFRSFVGLIMLWLNRLPTDAANGASQMPIIGALGAVFIGAPLGVAIGVLLCRHFKAGPVALGLFAVTAVTLSRFFV